MNAREAGRLGYLKAEQKISEHRKRKQESSMSAYLSNPAKCVTCKLVLPYEKRRNKYCSHSCAAIFTNGNRGVVWNKLTCSVAGCTNKTVRTNKFCTECYRSGKATRKASLEEAKTDKVRKQILLSERGHVCEGCDLSTWLGRAIPLELHHVDGNPDNNEDNNLKLLCSNCHACTDNYKSKNSIDGSKRQSRRLRYV